MDITPTPYINLRDYLILMLENQLDPPKVFKGVFTTERLMVPCSLVEQSHAGHPGPARMCEPGYKLYLLPTTLSSAVSR